jgi:hypothetical protein
MPPQAYLARRYRNVFWSPACISFNQVLIAMFFSKTNRIVDEFAKQLACDLASRYPASMEVNQVEKRNRNRLEKAFGSTFGRAMAFQREHKLGIYGKARLSNTFQWELKALGYPEEFVTLITSAMTKFVGNQR